MVPDRSVVIVNIELTFTVVLVVSHYETSLEWSSRSTIFVHQPFVWFGTTRHIVSAINFMSQISFNYKVISHLQSHFGVWVIFWVVSRELYMEDAPFVSQSAALYFFPTVHLSLVVISLVVLMVHKTGTLVIATPNVRIWKNFKISDSIDTIFVSDELTLGSCNTILVFEDPLINDQWRLGDPCISMCIL